MPAFEEYCQPNYARAPIALLFRLLLTVVWSISLYSMVLHEPWRVIATWRIDYLPNEYLVYASDGFCCTVIKPNPLCIATIYQPKAAVFFFIISHCSQIASDCTMRIILPLGQKWGDSRAADAPKNRGSSAWDRVNAESFGVATVYRQRIGVHECKLIAPDLSS